MGAKYSALISPSIGGHDDRVDEETSHGLGDANDPIGKEDKSVVDKTVAGRAWWPLHDVQLGLLVSQGEGRHHVGEQVDRKDGEGGEGKRDSEHHPGLRMS